MKAILFIIILFLGFALFNCHSEKRSCELFKRQYEDYAYCYMKNLSEFHKHKERAEIVFIGDSITEGFPYGDFFESSFVNLGISGNTTQDILNRFDEVFKYQPKVIVIHAGICDLSQGKGFNEIVANLRAMEKKAKDAGVEAVFCTVLPTLIQEKKSRTYYAKELELNDWIRRSLNCCDYFVALVGGDAFPMFPSYLTTMDYTIDGTHPTLKGYKVLGEAIKTKLGGYR